MIVPVVGYGNSETIGYWNEEEEVFILKEKGKRKRYRLKILKKLKNRHLNKGWDNSFSIRITEDKVNGCYQTYFNVCVFDENNINKKDIIFRVEGKVKYKF